MADDSMFTKDQEGNTAVRTVSAIVGETVTNSDSMFTKDANGNTAIRVTGVGGSGGDTHNKGWFATPAALREAYPEAEDGDYAIVGSTDTVWVWDSDTTDWKNTDSRGLVDSVNGQTGEVVLDGEDISATVFEGTEEESTDTISGHLETLYENVEEAKLPDPTGHANEFLTTDGTDASWSGNKSIVKDNVIIFGANNTLPSIGNTDLRIVVGSNNTSATNNSSIAIGKYVFATGMSSLAIGIGEFGNGVGATGTASTAIGAYSSASGQHSVALGYRSEVTAYKSIQLGDGRNTAQNTLSFGNANGNFELVSADGTIPVGRLTNVIADDSTTATNQTWSASKLDTIIGDIESLINAL